MKNTLEKREKLDAGGDRKKNKVEPVSSSDLTK